MSYVILLDTMGDGLRTLEPDIDVYSEDELEDAIKGVLMELVEEYYGSDISEKDFESITDQIVICEIVNKDEMINNMLKEQIKSNNSDEDEYQTYLKLKEKYEKWVSI